MLYIFHKNNYKNTMVVTEKKYRLDKEVIILLFLFLVEDGMTRKDFATKMGFDTEDMKLVESCEYEFTMDELEKMDEILESEVFVESVI